MTILASPAKAFLPTLCSTSAIRRLQWTSSASSPSSTLRHHYHLTNNVNVVCARQAGRPQRTSRRSRSLVSLFAATDRAKDAAIAAVEAAEEALNRAAEEAGAAAGAREVQVTVAAARAAARNAMESLRRDERGLSGEGGRDVLTPRQVSCVGWRFPLLAYSTVWRFGQVFNFGCTCAGICVLCGLPFPMWGTASMPVATI